MSYLASSTGTKNGVPGLTDDASKGYVVGSVVIDISAPTPVAYRCTSAGIGTATWVVTG